MQLWVGSSFLAGAWRRARHLAANMDTLAAYLFSVAALFTASGAEREKRLYFETPAVSPIISAVMAISSLFVVRCGAASA